MGSLEGAWVQWLRDGLAAVALVLAVAAFYESVQMRALQDRVSAQHADLVRAQTRASLDSGIVQLIARTAADKNDADLKALLARNGVTLRVQPAPAPAASRGAGQ